MGTSSLFARNQRFLKPTRSRRHWVDFPDIEPTATFSHNAVLSEQNAHKNSRENATISLVTNNLSTRRNKSSDHRHLKMI